MFLYLSHAYNSVLFLFPTYRSTIHPIITRLGVDALIGQLTRFREDDRFKAVTPESMVMSYWMSAAGVGVGANQDPAEQEGEIWFDWAFVDFWKSNHCESVMVYLRDVN